MIGMIRFLLPLRPPAGSRAAVRRGGLAGWPVRLLRISFRIVLFMLAAGAALLIGFPGPDPVALRQWVDESRATFPVVRTCVYVIVVWYGPVWRGATGADRDRARLALAAAAVVLEVSGTLRLIL